MVGRRFEVTPAGAEALAAWIDADDEPEPMRSTPAVRVRDAAVTGRTDEVRRMIEHRRDRRPGCPPAPGARPGDLGGVVLDHLVRPDSRRPRPARVCSDPAVDSGLELKIVVHGGRVHER